MAEDDNIVKKTCKELGLTYKQLGEAIGYSESAISNSARGIVSEQLKKALEMYLEIKELKKQLKECKELRNTLNSFLSKGDT